MKTYAPVTKSRRHMTGIDFSLLTKKEPEKKLTKGFKRMMGRNSKGRITVRHKGGGSKRLYRNIDFKQDKINIPGRVSSIEYDPNRSAFIALIVYKDGEKRYILAPHDLRVNDEIITSQEAPIKPGNRMPLYKMPVGSFVHNVELIPNKGGQIARSAGCSVQIAACEGGFAHLIMPSSEVRMIPEKSFASIGVLSNSEHNIITLGKAGRSRWLGKRPAVRGSVMNPCDHPHGGGEGRTSIGLRYPKTPWGKHALGVKTRNKKKLSNNYIVKRRKK